MSLRKDGRTSLFKEVRVFKEGKEQGNPPNEDGQGSELGQKFRDLKSLAVLTET